MGSADEVRERLPIDQVVGEVVTLKRAGNSLKGLCPFHNEKTPSFIVTPSKGIYKCFGCGQGGDIFSFVMATRHVDFPTALRELAAKAGVTIEDPQRERESSGLQGRIHDMNAVAATYYQSLLAAQAGARARAYLERRRIAPATIERFALGFAPDTRDGLCSRLRAAGYADEDLVAAGLAHAADERGPMRDRFRGRLIFPIRDAKGRIVGFGGRLLDDGEPKYLNSPATPVFDKSRVLYAVDHAADAIRAAREGVVVEGYVDALRAHQEGFPNVVASLGTSITESQLRALARLAPRLVLALDADPAGQKAAVRAGLAALGALPRRDGPAEPVRVYVATLPEGQDPDEAIADSPDTWRSAVAAAAPLMDHYFGLIEASVNRTRPEWRQEAIDALVPAIGQLAGVGVQQTYIERLGALTGVDARYLRDITPGAPAPQTAPRRERRRGPDSSAPAVSGQADPVRTTEEYLVSLLLAARPLSPELRAELATYTPLTAELVPLYAALIAGREVDPAQEDLADRLVEAAQRRPALSPHRLLNEVRVSLARVEEEHARRELRELGAALADVDTDTAHAMDGRTVETLALKEQLAVRLHREQMQRWRRTPE